MKTGRQRKRNRWFRNYQEKKKVWLSLNPDKDEMWIDQVGIDIDYEVSPRGQKFQGYLDIGESYDPPSKNKKRKLRKLAQQGERRSEV